jgi:hypothetical protein
MGYRFSGVGPVTVQGVSVGDLSEWTLDTDAKLEEVKNIGAAVKQSIAVNYGWQGSLKCELPLTPLTLGGSLGIGSWLGVNVNEWDFELEASADEATGSLDAWRVYNCGGIDWTANAERWQASDDYREFLQLILAQETSNGTPVNVVTPYGAGSGVLEKGAFSADGTPAKGKLTTKSAGGAFTTTEFFAGLMLAAANSFVASGYSAPTALTLGYAPDKPFVSGNIILTKASYKGPVGKVEISIDFQGTGALTLL